jgi:hypothetical protein
MTEHRNTVTADQIFQLTDIEAEQHYVMWLRDYRKAKTAGDTTSAIHAVEILATLARRIFSGDYTYEQAAEILRKLIAIAEQPA